MERPSVQGINLNVLLRRTRNRWGCRLRGIVLQEAIQLLHGVYVLASRFITAIDKIYEPRFLA